MALLTKTWVPWVNCLLTGALLAGACDDDDPGRPDAAVEAGAEVSPEAGSESGTDLRPDGAATDAVDAPVPDGGSGDGPGPDGGDGGVSDVPGADAPIPGGDPAALLDELAAALGGKAVVSALINERITASGKRLDPGESLLPGQTVHVADFQYTLQEELAAGRYNLAITNDTKFILPVKLQYTEVGNEGVGFVDGADNLFNPTPAKVAMPTARYASRLRHLDLASPLRIVRKMLAAPPGQLRVASVIVDLLPQKILTLNEPGRSPISLYVDDATKLPLRAETLEDHPPVGDSRVEVRYDNYLLVGNKVKLPHKLTIEVDDLVVHEETRSGIELDIVNVTDPYAVPPDLRGPINAADGVFGVRSAEWLLGFGYIGLPFLFQIQTGPPGPVVQAPVELAPGVKLIVGASHNVLVVEMPDHVVAVDAPLYEEYTSGVLAQIKAAFPGKPLKRVIATHFHYDHCGGIRELAAEGNVTVTVGKPTVPFFENVFKNPHTVDPDRLQMNQVPVVVEGVEGSLTLPTKDGGELQLHLISNTHANDMLIAYLKREKLVFEADLWTPTPAMPAAGAGGPFAKQLHDAITTRNLDVTTIVGAHSGTTGTMAVHTAPIAFLKSAAGL